MTNGQKKNNRGYGSNLTAHLKALQQKQQQKISHQKGVNIKK